MSPHQIKPRKRRRRKSAPNQTKSRESAVVVYVGMVLRREGRRWTTGRVGTRLSDPAAAFKHMHRSYGGHHPRYALPTEHRPRRGSRYLPLGATNNKLVLILTRHTLARAGLANRLLDRHEVVTVNGDVDTLRQATP